MPITSPLPSPTLKAPVNFGTLDIPKQSLASISEVKELGTHLSEKVITQVETLTKLPRKCQLLSSLRCGSKFRGFQRSGNDKFPVEIDIKMVDLANSNLCGYLKIENLTKENPQLTTYFEGEMVGKDYTFHTRKWNTNQDIDNQHWSKFEPFLPFQTLFNSDGFTYEPNDDFMFMRWKEMFLIPNHKKKELDGVSFSGFYYICYQISTGTITGYYYHPSAAEWFQDLNLSYVPTNTFPSYEFR